MPLRRHRLLAVLAALALAGPAPADPREDICEARAREMSGFKGASPRLEWERGAFNLSIRGSVAVGVERSSGPAVPTSRGGHGQVAQERFEDKRRAEEDVKARNFRRICDDCMRDR